MPNEPTDQPGIEVLENGPYRVTGVRLVRLRRVLSDEGGPIDWEKVAELEPGETFDLCRCGESSNKPFCDGSETKIGFDGTETADRRPTADRWREFGDGPAVLTDDTKLCARAGFCMARVPDAWDLADLTEDPERREQMAGLVRRCPSGRLGYLLPPGREPVEEELPQEVGVVVDGPYWVRGGVQVVAADGFRYEVRNRVTLCRCGHTRNKPFCDGSHIGIGFTDDA
jgi:CDGSH-type Zn-finger protein